MKNFNKQTNFLNRNHIKAVNFKVNRNMATLFIIELEKKQWCQLRERKSKGIIIEQCFS